MIDNKITIAICYDFDHTLTPFDMQEQGFLQKCCKYKKDDFRNFWKRVQDLKKDEKMDQTTAYMYQMIKAAEKAGNLIQKETLNSLGEKITFFAGLDDWFDKINKIGEENNCKIKHYIISNGNYEIIEGSKIFDKFDRVYASTFHYNDNGNADWPSTVINYTNKTQILFRIKKQVLDLYDDAVNNYVPSEDIPIPFSNIVYIGDSDTDIPCMQIIKNYEGYSICVYEKNNETRKQKAFKMFEEQRVNFYTEADYSEGKELYKIVSDIIRKIAISNKLINKHLEQKRYIEEIKKEQHKYWDIINNFICTSSFETTHSIVSKLNTEIINELNKEQLESIISAAENISRIKWIMGENDVKQLYLVVKNKCSELGLTEYVSRIDKLLE